MIEAGHDLFKDVHDISASEADYGDDEGEQDLDLEESSTCHWHES